MAVAPLTAKIGRCDLQVKGGSKKKWRLCEADSLVRFFFGYPLLAENRNPTFAVNGRQKDIRQCR